MHNAFPSEHAMSPVDEVESSNSQMPQYQCAWEMWIPSCETWRPESCKQTILGPEHLSGIVFCQHTLKCYPWCDEPTLEDNPDCFDEVVERLVAHEDTRAEGNRSPEVRLQDVVSFKT